MTPSHRPSCHRAWLALGLTASLSGLPAAAAPAASAAAAAAAPSSVSVERARGLFMLHCAGCHRVDGSGAPGFGVPTMINTLGQFQRTSAGRAFLLQVPGARNAAITDAELAALTNWAVKAFSAPTLPADFQPYTTAEVTHWRANAPLDIAGTREAVVAALPPLPAMTTYDKHQGDKHD